MKKKNIEIFQFSSKKNICPVEIIYLFLVYFNIGKIEEKRKIISLINLIIYDALINR